jgi:hypothetical protein
MRARNTRPVFASALLLEGGDAEFWWLGAPGNREATVIKTDRFGQRWVLHVKSTHWVTQRVAAGLLDVTFMTITNWISEGKITHTKKRNGVTVIPLKEVERIAEARGIFTQEPLSPEQRGAIKSYKRRRGGEKNADES